MVKKSILSHTLVVYMPPLAGRAPEPAGRASELAGRPREWGVEREKKRITERSRCMVVP